MKRSDLVDEQLDQLAAHLTQRRSILLQAWRTAVQADPEVSTANALPRRQFIDHIPAILDALERRLRHLPRRESADARVVRRMESAVHGLVRWQQGYDLREVTREWAHLHSGLLDELETYAAEHPTLEPGVMPIARRCVTETCNDGVCESTSQFFALRQIEAEGELRDLESTLSQAQDLERQRAELWRQAAHDLRGNVSAVTVVAAGLTLQGLAEPARDKFVRSLQRSVSALQVMLDDVTNLARLQAGRESRAVAPFDAAETMRDLCAGLESEAETRGLFLRPDGPWSLPVEGDAGKVRRIAQNLILNALKYTQTGGVTVSWGDSDKGDADRWRLSVLDTGPGVRAASSAPLAAALEDAMQAGAGAATVHEAATGTPSGAAPEGTREAPHVDRGEGIGLTIVKRLCELLDATFRLESTPQEGTTAVVLFPRRYDASSVSSG